MTVVVRRVLGKDNSQVPLANDEYPVGALPAYGARPALRVRVRAGRLRRRLDHVDSRAGEHRVEDGRKPCVPVAEQEPYAGDAVVEARQQVAGLLPDPCAGRMRGYPDADL